MRSWRCIENVESDLLSVLAGDRGPTLRQLERATLAPSKLLHRLTTAILDQFRRGSPDRGDSRGHLFNRLLSQDLKLVEKLPLTKLFRGDFFSLPSNRVLTLFVLRVEQLYLFGELVHSSFEVFFLCLSGEAILFAQG